MAKGKQRHLDFKIGERLTASIALRETNTHQLRKKTGVGAYALDSIINGKRNCTLETVYILARALNVSPGWLAFGEYDVVDPE